MRLSSAFILLGATISTVLATPQGLELSALSQCIQTAAADLIQSAGCSLLDLRCMCRQPSFLQTLESSVRGNCGEADVEPAVSFGTAECAALGVPLTTNATSTTTSMAPSASSSMAPSASSSMAPVSGNTTWNGTNISPTPYMGAGDRFKGGDFEAAALVVLAVALTLL